MKINIKTNSEGKIIESCPTNLEDSSTITVTKEQFELLQLQYDTIVENWSIVSQVKWEDATNLEIAVAAQEAAKAAEEAEQNT